MFVTQYAVAGKWHTCLLIRHPCVASLNHAVVGWRRLLTRERQKLRRSLNLSQIFSRSSCHIVNYHSRAEHNHTFNSPRRVYTPPPPPPSLHTSSAATWHMQMDFCGQAAPLYRQSTVSSFHSSNQPDFTTPPQKKKNPLPLLAVRAPLCLRPSLKPVARSAPTSWRRCSDPGPGWMADSGSSCWSTCRPTPRAREPPHSTPWSPPPVAADTQDREREAFNHDDASGARLTTQAMFLSRRRVRGQTSNTV